jgi:NifU-like protein involved in Fe-S cluster formation
VASFSAKLSDHFNSPRNGGALENADAVGHGSLDGSAPYTTIFLRIEDSTIRQAGFQTFGCGVSIACASVLTELVTGQTLDSGRRITAQDVIDALDGVPEEKQFCAGLAVAALRDALRQCEEVCVTRQALQ